MQLEVRSDEVRNPSRASIETSALMLCFIIIKLSQFSIRFSNLNRKLDSAILMIQLSQCFKPSILYVHQKMFVGIYVETRPQHAIVNIVYNVCFLIVLFNFTEDHMLDK